MPYLKSRAAAAELQTPPPVADNPEGSPLDQLLRLLSASEDEQVRTWANRLSTGEAAASEPAAKRRDAPRA
jgi:hypothetical protein